MKKTIMYLILAVVLLLGVSYINQKVTEKMDQTPVALYDEQYITSLVKDFGNHLKNVTVGQDVMLLTAHIQREYSPFITTPLLERWVANPTDVPGVTTPGIIPTHLEIMSMVKVGDYYQISGEVIYQAQEKEYERRKVFILVSGLEGAWKIAEFQLADR